MRKILKAFCITLLALCIAGNGLLIPNHVFADVADTAPEEEALITKDYPEMARQLELLYERADIGNNRLNPTYGAMMKREEVISLTPSLQNRLRQLAKPTFSDIAGDEWYAPHIPMAVYRKLMNGFPDSTFRGKTPVTRAELLTMLARFNDSEGTIKQKARQDAKSRELIAGLMGDKWYTDYIVVSRDGLIHLDQYTRDTIVEPMTRGEVFYALANLLWKEDIREGGKYHAMAVKNENPAFSDTGKTITIANPDAYGSGAESFQWYKQYMRAAENPKAGVPMDIYPAIICLKEKGILQGSNGESKWYDSISRGEALALFERLAKVWGEEERGKAESYDTEHDNAEVPGGGGTSGGDPGSGSSGPGDPDTRIRVLPGVNVEVGEEVYFDGAYYLGEYDESVQWEWDFGDGYTLKAGEPKNTTFDTGLCVIHYFMIPGTYEVRLNVSRFDMSKSPPVRQELLHTDSVTVHVSGEAPMAGFELRHAPFHARTAQYLYAVVPPGYSPNQVSVRLESPEGNLVQALSGVTEDGKQRFLLENAKLPAGDYVVVAELKNGQETVSTIRERFSKPYDGAPEIGINENNAFVLNGNDLFFPIGPWLLDKDSIPMWRSASNTLFAMGYYPVRDEAAWSDYINAADSKDMKAIGPVGWKEFNKRNSSPDIMTGYIETSKGLDGLLGWCWDDEPNLGGRYGCVPATVTAAWSYWTGLLDPQHPTVQQYYGYDYLPHYRPREQEHGYSYMRNANLFGGKKAFTADFITFDIYPIEYKEHASLNYDSRGVVDLWAEAMDTFRWNMDDLIPLGTFVETQNVTTWDRMSNNKYETEWDAGPTPGDLRTQLWTAIVHNMKAVFYFNHFAETPMDNMSVLNEFNEAVTDLAPVILAPPSSHTVTHNCHKRGQRVDLMVRETTTDYYIFAVRVTEPESEWGEVPEPDNIEFVLNTGTQATVAYDILPGYSWEYGLFDVTEAKKTFHFDLKEGIKPGSVLISVADKVTGVIPEKLVDRWTDKEYSAVLDKQGVFANGYDDGAGKIVPIHSFKNIKRGTIDYDTGEVNVEFNNNVPQGESYIQIAYAVNDRPVRTLTGTGGVFRDTLERNAVRIYRIPKDQH